MKYILASQSPRRRELLARTGLEFEVIPSDVDEKITKESLLMLSWNWHTKKLKMFMEKLLI